MEPTLREGDLLLIDLRQTKVTDDAIYVLSLDGRLLAKRLQLAVGGTIYIRSDNPVYKELTVSKDNTEDLHVIGRVIWIGRRV
jgi:phage repressor protein C with HTH and peptisase S24 domain